MKKTYRRVNITKQTIESIKKHPNMYLRSPIRTQMGKIYTDDEFKKRSDRVLKKKLP